MDAPSTIAIFLVPMVLVIYIIAVLVWIYWKEVKSCWRRVCCRCKRREPIHYSWNNRHNRPRVVYLNSHPAMVPPPPYLGDFATDAPPSYDCAVELPPAYEEVFPSEQSRSPRQEENSAGHRNGLATF